MLKHKLLFILTLLLLLIVLTGCTSTTLSTNIENYYYVVAIGLDYKDDSTIILSIQIATSDSSSTSDSSQSYTSAIYSTDCKSINSGISILDNYLSKKLNFSHCSAIIFSEDLAKKGVKTYVNTFANYSDIRPTCNVIISNTTAKKTLENISNSSENFSANLYEFIVNSVDYTGYSIDPKLGDFFFNLNTNGASCVATYANIQDNTLQNTGIAVFDEDKYLANLTVLDSIAYSLVTNNLNSCIVTITNPFDETQTIDIKLSPKQKTKTNISLENNYPFIKINANLEYTIEGATESFNYKSQEVIDIVEKQVNSYLTDITLDFLYKISHEYNQDICNFQNIVSKDYLTLDDLKKINWPEIYKESYFKVDIKGTITNVGLFTKD